METAMSLIDVQEVSHSYAGGVPALRQVSLKIEKGERVAVLGPNGAGKSTLFHTFNGLLQASSGKIYVDGLLVEKKNLYQIRSKIGLVFQDSDDQLFNSTVRQEVAYGPMHMSITGKELDNTVNWALDAAGISGYSEKSPHNLSGGEKKRVALASVLAMKPNVLVLDEPTASLDPQGANSLIKLLNEINEELGITLIFSSHDADIIPLLSDRTYLMNAGEIIFSGTTTEVFAQKDILRQIGLRLPRVAHLAEILIKQGCLEAEGLPLTIGQARRLLEKFCCLNNLHTLDHDLGLNTTCLKHCK
jgi:cobalt/nickel transport system ATP-binding protein